MATSIYAHPHLAREGFQTVARRLVERADDAPSTAQRWDMWAGAAAVEFAAGVFPLLRDARKLMDGSATQEDVAVMFHRYAPSLDMTGCTVDDLRLTLAEAIGKIVDPMISGSTQGPALLLTKGRAINLV